MRRLGAVICFGIASGGCARIERTITVTSDPEHALVYLNDQEIGRTPVTRNFKWYGTYDVEVRQEGYETLKTRAAIIAPWWQWVPFDFIAECIPGTHRDDRTLHYTLHEPRIVEVDPTELVHRGEELKTELESGQRTKFPQTRPAKRSATQPTTAPATPP